MKTIITILSLMLASWGVNAQWVQTNGPSGGGNIASIISYDDYVFAGEYNGIYRSEDRGKSWNRILRDYTGLAYFALYGNEIWIGTNGRGMLRSRDNGITWTEMNVGLPPQASIYSIAIMDSKIFIALAFHKGVYMSSDAGQSWTKVHSGWENEPVFLGVSGNKLYAGIWNEGVYVSANNGYSWTLINEGLGDLWIQSLGFIGTKVFVGTNWHGAYVLSADGNSWIPVNMGYPYLSITGFALSDTNFYASASGDGVYISRDTGITWTLLNEGLPEQLPIDAITVTGNYLYLGTYGQGVFSSNDYGNSWAESNKGIPCTDVRALAIYGSTIFGGTSAYGLFKSSDQGLSWDAVGAGVLDELEINALVVSGTDIFAGTPIGIYKSTDAGNTWNQCLSAGSIVSFALNGTDIYAADYYGSIYISADHGLIWAQRTNGLPAINISSVAVLGSSIYAGTEGGGVYISADNGNYWQPSNEGLTNMYVTSLALMGNRIYAGTFGGGLYVSENGGSSWNSIFYGYAIREVAIFGPNIFIGTRDDGTFYSTDQGNSWTYIRYNEGLGWFNVLSFAFNGKDVYAGTEGGGVFINQSLLTGINENTPNQQVRWFIYPNPAIQNITIQSYKGPEDAYLSLFNIHGQRVLGQTLTDTSTSVDISMLPSGMYFIHILQDGLIHSAKLIKE